MDLSHEAARNMRKLVDKDISSPEFAVHVVSLQRAKFVQKHVRGEYKLDHIHSIVN